MQKKGKSAERILKKMALQEGGRTDERAEGQIEEQTDRWKGRRVNKVEFIGLSAE